MTAIMKKTAARKVLSLTPSPVLKSGYNVIRSSESNLKKIVSELNEAKPNSVVRPLLTVMRRVRGKRRVQPVKVQMYPGYAFVRPDAYALARIVNYRWSHHYLRDGEGGCVVVPDEQLAAALRLERRSRWNGETLSPHTRVEVVDGEMAGWYGVVQKSEEQFALVWMDRSPIPVFVHLSDLALAKATLS